MTPLPEEFIVIVAPCPLAASAREGWMSRIRAVDRIFENSRRIYIDPYSGAEPGALVPRRHGELVDEYRVDLTNSEHHALLERLILGCRFVYCHTMHLGRFLLPFYPTGKIITDVHGIVPEEERMLGRPVVATFYEGVERFILKNSQIVVVVTNAMRDHLLAKHPDCNAQFVCLPIIETYDAALDQRVPRKEGDDYRVIYAGGIQVWQNIDLTLAISDKAAAFATFEFLSNEHAAIRDRAAGMSLLEKARFGVVGKEELPQRYLASDLGFVLRDDTAVNRVSCPTKLSEYLWFGVIPIIKTPHIGDFLAEGFCFVTAEEFSAGLLPDEARCAEMRRTNRAVLDKLIAQFDDSAEMLRSLSLPNLVRENTLAGLPIGDRHLRFPAQAELYLFTDGMHHFVRDVIDTYDKLKWQPDVSEPVRAVRIIPMVADVTVLLEEMCIEASEDVDNGITVACMTPGRPAPRGVALAKSAPYFDFHFSKPVRLRDVTVRLHFVSFGADPAASGNAPSGASVAVRWSGSGASEGLKSDVAITYI